MVSKYSETLQAHQGIILPIVNLWTVLERAYCILSFEPVAHQGDSKPATEKSSKQTIQ